MNGRCEESITTCLIIFESEFFFPFFQFTRLSANFWSSFFCCKVLHSSRCIIMLMMMNSNLRYIFAIWISFFSLPSHCNHLLYVEREIRWFVLWEMKFFVFVVIEMEIFQWNAWVWIEGGKLKKFIIFVIFIMDFLINFWLFFNHFL